MKSRKKLKAKIQGLEKRNDALLKEIQTLVFEPNSYRATEIKVLYGMLRSMEETVLFGTCEWRNSNVMEDKS